MSQPAPEPASAPALRHDPAALPGSRADHRGHLLLGALVLVRDNSGAEHLVDVETFSPAPSSLVATVAAVPASVYDAVGVSSPANPVTPLQPAGAAARPLWRASGGGAPEPVVFFYGAEFAPVRSGRALAAGPRPVALRHLQPARLMQSSSTTAFANLSTFTFWNVVVHEQVGRSSQSVERYSSLNPTGARYLGLADARRPAGRGDRRLRDEPDDVLARSTWPTATSSTAPPSLPACWPGSHRTRSPGTSTMPASPLTQAVVTAANEITATICSVDGDRPGARVRAPRRRWPPDEA